MKYKKSEAKEYAREHMVGVWAANLTPFDASLKLDEKAYRENLDHWINTLNLGGLFIAGKQAEFFSMSLAERKKLMELSVEVAHEAGNRNGKGHCGIVTSCSDTNLDVVLELAERLGLKQGDPLVPARIHLRPAQEIAAAHAVASAVRHLSEREAAFKVTDLAKAALDFGLPTTMPLIEKRITQLADQGALSKGRGTMQGWLTTTDAAALERRMLAEIDRGIGAATPILPSDVAGPQLQAAASFNFGMTLNAGQEWAGRKILSSSNRIVAVQGVAGAGKSSLLRTLIASFALTHTPHEVQFYCLDFSGGGLVAQAAVVGVAHVDEAVAAGLAVQRGALHDVEVVADHHQRSGRHAHLQAASGIGLHQHLAA